jgi:hypothetical protein
VEICDFDSITIETLVAEHKARERGRERERERERVRVLERLIV